MIHKDTDMKTENGKRNQKLGTCGKPEKKTQTIIIHISYVQGLVTNKD